MITNFKIFESRSKDKIAENLVDQLDDSYIDQFFRDNYSIDVEEMAKYMDIWQFVDDDKFVEDWIDDRVSNDSLNDIGNSEEYQDYIEKKLLDNENVQEYLEKMRVKKGLEEGTTYSEILDELKENQLEKIIIKIADHEEECLRTYWENIYGRSSAYDIMRELYSESDLQENGYKYMQNYVIDSQIEDYFYDNENYNYKCEFVAEQIERNIDLQLKILDKDPKNSLDLFEIMGDFYDECIGDEYEFQKAFMETVIENNTDEDGTIYDDYVAKKFKKLYDKFGLDPKIEQEYKQYNFYIDAIKYNL